MRTHEVYEFACVCGAALVSASRDLICPQCQRAIRLDWGARKIALSICVFPRPLVSLDLDTPAQHIVFTLTEASEFADGLQAAVAMLRDRVRREVQ